MLAPAMVVCLGAVYAAVQSGLRPSFFYSELGLFGRFSGLLTVASGLMMSSAGILLVLVARTPAIGRESLRVRVAWCLAGGGMLLMGLDEVAGIHEWIGGGLAHYGVPRPFGVDADIYPVAAYGAGALACLCCLSPILPRLAAGLPYAGLMFFLFCVSQIVDLIPLEGLAESTVLMLAPVEEVPKVLGAYCGLLMAVHFLEQAAQQTNLQLVLTRSPATERPRSLRSLAS